MKRALEQQQKELAEKRKQFDEDKKLFDEEHQRYMEELEASMRWVSIWYLAVSVMSPCMVTELQKTLRRERSDDTVVYLYM